VKINWFSPLPPAHTDIANYTARILPELSRVADVVLWADQDVWDDELAKCAEVRRYSSEGLPVAELSSEVNVFNSGNNVEYHAGIWSAMSRLSGIVILHDPVLADFFAATYFNSSADLDGYLAQMDFYYGKAGERAGTAFFRAAIKGAAEGEIDSLCRSFPMTPLVLERAQAVMTHSAAVAQDLGYLGLFPVEFAHLPFPAREYVGTSSIVKDNSGPLRLIVFGFIGPNRCLEKTLAALRPASVNHDIRLDIYGELWDPNFIRKMVRDLGLDEIVTVHGYVEEAELEAALSAADLCINLRFPSRGEASGSQLRIWASGCPSIVTRTGWYAELDPSTIIAVEPGSEISGIQAAIDMLLNDRRAFDSVAAAGLERLRVEHSPAKYVNALIELIDRRLPETVDHRRELRSRTSPDKLNDAAVEELLARKERRDGYRSHRYRYAHLMLVLRMRQLGGRILKSRLIAPIFGDRLRSFLKSR